jgi:hypothetical protein
MDAVAAPPRGAIVIYLDGTQLNGDRRSRVAEVVGPMLVDPDSGDLWMGVLLPTVPRRVDMIECASVTTVVG